MKNRLELKILLLLIVVLIIGFGTYVVIFINRESNALLEQQRQKSKLFSETVMVGIRNVMLSGKAPYAAELVNDARENLTFGTLRIYNNKAAEVFPDEGRGLIANAGDRDVRRAIQTEMEVMLTKKDSTGERFVRIEPLLNDRECQQCHSGNHTVRGATKLALMPEVMVMHPRGKTINDANEVKKFVTELISNTLAVSFRNIMLAGEGKLMDTLVHRVNQLPFIDRIKVYDRYAAVHFGDEDETANEDSLLQTLETAEPIMYAEKKGAIFTRLIPLRNEERCQVCHGSKAQWRGVMEVGLKTKDLKLQPAELEEQLTGMLQEVIGAGFRSIMMVGKGSYARNYINEVRKIHAVSDLRVFDKDANERFVNIQTKDYGLGYVKDALKKDTVIEAMQWINGEEFLVRYSPLHNGKRCQVCHGDDHTIRGVVGVTASMTEINTLISRNRLYSGIAGVTTILLVWLVLRIFMKFVVIKPIGTIGEVVGLVGAGNLSVATNITSKDEIGELAKRINEMIKGLRERFHLEKFVSQQTVDYVKKSDERGVKLGGERKEATVFFSDVRGFTAFSEKVEPERVVTMLNNILSRQAMIVRKFGGDIDKYVGDELVAVFQGENMVLNAVQCAIEIQKMMESIYSEIGEEIAIGIGINTGEMVMGAMGSEERMDFTVIGDAVNLGARLCSAAGRGQVLISEFAAKYIFNDSTIELTKLEPIKVKGKEAFIQIYEAKARV